MKYDFNFYNPTRIHFGVSSLDMLKNEMEKYGKKILLVYGKASIKKIGLYDKILNILEECNKEVYELSGVGSNPTYAKMMEGCRIARQESVDFILAVGGGSVIDCSKGIAAGTYSVEDPFQKYYISNDKINNKVIPLGTVLTMVGTGSEMNTGSVITNTQLKLKKGHNYEEVMYPKFSILDPTLTYSVPQYQMLSGIFDIMSHLMEQYFSGDDDNVSDYLVEALLKSLIANTPKAIANPKDYEVRSNIMWASTMALNGLMGLSKTQDWMVHSIEHQVGAYTFCAHGMGLAAVSPSYYRYIYKDGLAKFVRFAKNVWNVDAAGKTDDEVAREGISCLEKFIAESQMVTNLSDLGVTSEMVHDIAYSTDLGGGYKAMTHEDVLEVLKEAM